MSAFQRIGQKLKNIDYEGIGQRIGQKVRHGAQVLARKSVNTLARAADFGSKVLPVAQGVSTALGMGAETAPLFSAAQKGLNRIKDYHSRAKGVQAALKGL